MRLLAAAGALTALTAASSGTDVEIRITGLRNPQGMVHLCLSQDPKRFLDCKSDPLALTLSRPAKDLPDLYFRAVPDGVYALAVVHDENGNGKLDTFLAIPREGFGFSRNPKIRVGPPRFGDVRFPVDGGTGRQQVTMKYIL